MKTNTGKEHVMSLLRHRVVPALLRMQPSFIRIVRTHSRQPTTSAGGGTRRHIACNRGLRRHFWGAVHARGRLAGSCRRHSSTSQRSRTDSNSAIFVFIVTKGGIYEVRRASRKRRAWCWSWRGRGFWLRSSCNNRVIPVTDRRVCFRLSHQKLTPHLAHASLAEPQAHSVPQVTQGAAFLSRHAQYHQTVRRPRTTQAVLTCGPRHRRRRSPILVFGVK
jgi:hypothetical protein